jgi:hypothetical protein
VAHEGWLAKRVIGRCFWPPFGQFVSLNLEDRDRRSLVASESGSDGELLLDLEWDELRGDPRFEKIVASLAPKN